MAFLLICLAAFSIVSEAICNSLAQGGGGSLGSYEAGVFNGLVTNLPAAEVNYSAYVGISAGSLNSLTLAQFAPGDEVNASNFLVNSYLTINGSQSVFVDWEGGVLDGLLFHSGLYNTTPESILIKTHFIQPIQHKVSLGTTNIASGLYNVYNESISNADLIEATMCSSAIPMLFQTQAFNGGVYNDGGIYNMIDVDTAIERCFEETDVPEDIVIDMIICFRHTLDPDTKFKTPDVMFRVFEIHSYFASIKSLQDAMVAYPGINFRYFIQPSIDFPPYDALDFNRVFLQKMIDLGISDAKNAINNPINVRAKFEKWSEYDEIIYP